MWFSFLHDIFLNPRIVSDLKCCYRSPCIDSDDDNYCAHEGHSDLDHGESKE